MGNDDSPGPCPPRGVPPVEGPSIHGQPYDPRLDPDQPFNRPGETEALARAAQEFGLDSGDSRPDIYAWDAEPGAACDEVTVHPADYLAARFGPSSVELGSMRLLCDEQVGRDGAATGMWEYRNALSRPVMQLVAAFCFGITETRPLNQPIGRNGNPYIDRWFLARKTEVPQFSGPPDFADLPPFMSPEIENLYLHRYHRGDADEPHDHPWPNASLVVHGWYRESVYDERGRLVGTVTRQAGDIVLRRATSIHAVLETSEGCLSLFATLRKERDWGFHTADGFVPWREFEKGK